MAGLVNLDPRINSRQFLLSTRVLSAPGLTVRGPFGPSLHLARHPNLPAAHCTDGHKEVLVLGEIIDPAHPGFTNDDVVGRLFKESFDFESFERAAYTISGRWVAIVRFGSEVRLYPDAAGTRPVFFLRSADGISVASQPGLLAAAAGAELDRELHASFFGANHGDSWPFGLTPFRSVRQLLPNHSLDMVQDSVRRFWPTTDLPAQDLDVAAKSAIRILRGTVAAMLHRGKTTLPLTAGYDSRTIFAASVSLLEHLSFARVSGHHLPFYDTLIPRAIARHYGIALTEIPGAPASPELVEVLRSNTGGMMWDRADYMLPSFGNIQTDYLLLGQVSEITRCFYYKSGEHPRHLDASQIAKITRYGGNSSATQEIGAWLAAAPDLLSPSTLDLVYWEHRVGNWASMVGTAIDTFCSVVFPYNSRELISTLLGVDRRYRIAPYALHRRICELADPESIRFEFNDSWADRLVNASHWRVRRAVATVRRRMAGIPNDQRLSP